MRVGSDLKTKALLALEEVTHDCRYRVPERTHSVRFALAWLFSVSRFRDVEPFHTFWRAIGGTNDLFRFREADQALDGIYLAVGAQRDEGVSNEIWRAAHARHQTRAREKSC